ncbi:MAG: DUF1801 domain-containing protein [Bacteroidetes bacterium]|nr:DUF1801 domain-containing protein [Bacteroidota bacterium]
MAKLAQIKTKETSADVKEFISSLKDEQQRKDSLIVLKMMQKASGEKPKLWGSALIGFGKLIYTSPATGRQVEWFRIGFSPRKGNLSLYFMDLTIHAAAMKKLGKHTAGKGCIYIKRLEDVDLTVLEKMVAVTAKR